MSEKALSWVRALLVCAGVLGLGCQTYDFEPFDPFTLAQVTQRRVLQRH
jgi:hypothetical protein